MLELPWGGSVAELLKNPKYTGYQVYNRRARRSRGGRNKPNPPEMWVWSPEPAHEPLMPKWMFDEFNARSTARQGSRDGSGLKNDPRVTRAYRFRRRVLCDRGRRMIGNHGTASPTTAATPRTTTADAPTNTPATQPRSTCAKTSS
jgi:hypothetical protein